MSKPQKRKRRKDWQCQSMVRPVWVLEMYYKGHCHYCGKKVTHDKMTIDHVIPKSKGGKTEEKNCVPSCYDCNQLKRTSNYGDFKAGLIMAGSCGTM